MRPTHRSRLLTLAATAVLSVGVAAPASAAKTDQDGLVNVALTDNTVQVPVSVAANICGVAVNVLARGVNTGDVDCNAGAEAVAVDRKTGGGSKTDQNGLVNLAVTDNTIQIPVAVAANVCDVDVSVLSAFIDTADVACTAQSKSGANA
jgi:hypothetical protein